MKRCQRILSVFFAVILLFSSVDSAVLAEGQEDSVTVSSNDSEVLGDSVSENELPETEESVSDNDVPELEESVSDNVVEETPEDDVSANDVSENKMEASMTMTTSEVTASGKCGDNLSWTLSDGVLTISGTGAMEDYHEYGTLAPWDQYKENITSLVLSEGITRIGDYAFYCCSNIAGSLIIPATVEEIGAVAFYSCNGFTGDLVIPDTVKVIGASAFAQCTGLDGSLKISSSLETIPQNAFKQNRNLKGDLSIPSGIKRIEMMAFAGCSGFNGNLVIPETVHTIEASAFDGCSGFTGDLIIPNGVGSVDCYAFADCAGFTGDLIIADSVTKIEYNAFDGCSGFTGKLQLSGGLEKIEKKTFLDCSGFTGDLIIPDSVKEIEESAFSGCEGFNGKLVLPNQLTSIGNYAFSNCSALTGNLTIPDSVEIVGCSAFSYCSGFDGNLEISDKMTQIESNTFLACYALTGDLYLGNNVISIGSEAFKCCYGLSGVFYMPKTVTSIAADAFEYSFVDETNIINKLYGEEGSYAQTYAQENSISFIAYIWGIDRLAAPVASVESGSEVEIGTKITLLTESEGADIYYTTDGTSPAISGYLYTDSIAIYEDCTIKAITMQEGYQYSEIVTLTYSVKESDTIVGGSSGDVKWCLNLNTGLLSIYGQGEMGSDCPWKEYSSSIKQLIIENGITSIASQAFSDCTSIKGILALPNSLELIGWGAFSNCSGLTGDLVIPDSVTYISDSAFEGCSGFSGKIVLPVNLEFIGYRVFEGCSGLRGEINLPKHLTSIGYKAFSGCKNLTGDIIVPDKVIEIQASAFENCVGLEGYTVYLPDSIESISSTAFCKVNNYQYSNLDITIKCNPGTYAEKWAKENGFFGKIKISPIPDQTFTGTKVKPKVEVSHGDKILVEGKDYTLAYKNNVNAGEQTASVIVKGKGNYSGQSDARKFTINPKEITGENIVAQSLTPTYSGKVQNPSPTITVDGKKLTKNKNYTLSYPDTANRAYREAGIWNIVVTGKGNYIGETIITFRILDKTEVLATKLSVSKISAVEYEEGQKAEPKPVISYKGTKLVEGEDYSLSYSSNDKAGKATMTITGLEKEGKVSVVGTCTKTFTIKGTAISKAKVEYSKTQPFTGSQICPQVKLTVDKGATTLREGTDYSVSYGVNTKVGKGTIIITGMGGYTGTMKKTFTIQAVNMTASADDIQIKFADGVGETSYALAGAKPEVEVYWGETKLEYGTDYTVSYKNNKAVKDAAEAKAPTVTVKGKGNYKGSKSAFYTITEKDLTDADITVSVPDKVYNAKGKYQSTPVITDGDGKKLKAGKNYKILGYYVDGEELPAISVLPVGTEVTVKAQGIGSYQKEIEATYRIVERDISKAAIKITAVEYTGDPITFTEEDFTNGNIEVTGPKGVEAPVYGQDFIISGYKNNTNKGTAQVTFKGISDEWGGSKTVKFTIKVKKMK